MVNSGRCISVVVGRYTCVNNREDINITFPVDRLEELVQSGYIGELSDNYYSYMGAINDVTGLIEDSGPEVGNKLLAEDVDVVLLVPT